MIVTYAVAWQVDELLAILNNDGAVVLEVDPLQAMFWE